MKKKEARIRAAKSKRRTLNSRNHHEEQCLLVSDDKQDATHGVYMTSAVLRFLVGILVHVPGAGL